MTLRHMIIFRAVCDEGCNATRAAEKLHMSQPAVSLAVRELESYYGVRLFDRLGRRLQITQAGERFLRYAIHITDLFDDMETALHDWDAQGVLRVGASITIGSQFLPGYVRAFADLRPGTDVRVVVGPADMLERKLLENELDLVLTEGLEHDENIVAMPYMEDHLSVICAAGGAWRQGERIPLEVFRNQRFLLREEGSGTREVFDRAMAQAGVRVKPVWEAMSTTALVSAVINGLGVAVLPYRMIRPALEKGLIVTVAVEGLSFRRSFRMLVHRDKYLTDSARQFMALCRHYEEDYPLPDYHGLY